MERKNKMPFCTYCKKELIPEKTWIETNSGKYYCDICSKPHSCKMQKPLLLRNIHPIGQNNSLTGTSKMGYSKLKVVDENSVEALLFSLIDDIDTAIDIFKPKMEGYEKYICRKIDEAKKLIVSDGYKLYYVKKEE